MSNTIQTATGNELCFVAALQLTRMLRNRDVAAVDVMEAFLAQIERINPLVNAIPTLRPHAELLAEARAADRTLSGDNAVGLLHGLPMAIKDLARTRGIVTTFGSLIYREHVPDEDELYVQRLKQAGAIIIGKTNTPEFGAGSQTFNRVFGATRNPYDLSKTCGGSSGGAAVALACGMLPLADGSDVGGSLRNPASFCNIVGFRPSPGCVAQHDTNAVDQLGVQGPLARSVADLALLLSVMAGEDTSDAISGNEPTSGFLRPLSRDFTGTRIAWSRNLGGYPVEPAVTETCHAARSVLEGLGCDVEDREPDFSGVDEVFQTLRAARYAVSHAEDLAAHRDLLKDTVIWNIEQGLKLSERDVELAEDNRKEFVRRVDKFLERYEFLILPVVQVAPFPIDIDWPRTIDGVAMKTYIDWMASCYAISVAALPAISVPCGFTAQGLPIGLQIVGRRQQDFSVLQLAHAFEQITRYGRRRPSIVEN